jgi:hypothetical protein
MRAAQNRSDLQDLHGRRVQFCISDACVPEPTEILAKLHGHDMVHGRVTEFTDSGTDIGAFAVVHVVELDHPVVVPTRCLKQDE